MQRLKSVDVVVPSDNEGHYFRYRHTETGVWSHSSIYSDGQTGCVEQYLDHRRANNLPIPDDYEAVIQNQMCESWPPEWCDRPSDQSWVPTRFSIDDFTSGMKAFAGLLTAGEFTTQDEADRRARICANCPYNGPLPGCSGCRKLASFITGTVASKSTKFDSQLKACAVCKCAIQAMVHFPMKVLDDVSTPEKQALYPKEFCWKSHESPNYIPDV